MRVKRRYLDTPRRRAASFPTGHGPCPGGIFQVPINGTVETFFEADVGVPIQGCVQFVRVHRVAPIVSGAILDKGDQVGMREHRIVGSQFVQPLTDGSYYLDVGALTSCTDVIAFSYHALAQNRVERIDVIINIEPVACVFAFSVDRDRLTNDCFCNGEGNQFFGKLIRTKVVGAIRDDGRQTIGSLPCIDEVIRGRFAGGVGRARIVGAGFYERGFGKSPDRRKLRRLRYAENEKICQNP